MYFSQESQNLYKNRLAATVQHAKQLALDRHHQRAAAKAAAALAAASAAASSAATTPAKASGSKPKTADQDEKKSPSATTGQRAGRRRSSRTCGNLVMNTLAPLTEHHASLTQTSTFALTLSRESHETILQVDASIPCQLLVSYWQRYSLTPSCVDSIINSVPARACWAYVVLLGKEVSSSAIKPSFATPTDILVSGRAQALRRIVRATADHLRKLSTKQTALPVASCTETMPDVPFAPLVYVSPKLVALALTQITPTLDLFGVTRVMTLYTIDGCMWLPRTTCGSGVRCTKVVTKEVADQAAIDPGRGLSTRLYTVSPRRRVIVHDSVDCVVTVDDAPGDAVYCVVYETVVFIA